MYKFRIFIFLLTAVSFGIAQNGEIIPLSSKVGMIVDAEENIHYRIFPDINGFESAQFYEVSSNKIIAKIVFVEYTHRRVTRKALSLKQFVTLQNRVNIQPAITDQDRRAVRENLTYLETDEVLSEIPVDQYVTLKHRDGANIKGTLLSYDGKWLGIQTPVSILSMPVWELERISYRDHIVQRSKWKPVVFVMCATLGLALSEVWNRQTAPRIEMEWHYRFLGIVFGLLAGSEAYDSMNILLTPKQVFELTPAEMEKLRNE